MSAGQASPAAKGSRPRDPVPALQHALHRAAKVDPGRRFLAEEPVEAELGLEPKQAKTRIIHLQVGGDGFEFLGFHHWLVCSGGDRGKPKVAFLARWPADKAMQHARDRIREITSRRWMLLLPEAIVES
ncbi:hypothetical protein [Actinomadura sp. HBU206391]|uniref:hypothetical protein n=1 Tax=Actinomadura sp. HBU206391 TaxID=2731692 RepID=UPI001C9C250A|nr:hypothetical protein [Actinomadura sp. HBU206391]